MFKNVALIVLTVGLIGASIRNTVLRKKLRQAA